MTLKQRGVIFNAVKIMPDVECFFDGRIKLIKETPEERKQELDIAWSEVNTRWREEYGQFNSNGNISYGEWNPAKYRAGCDYYRSLQLKPLEVRVFFMGKKVPAIIIEAIRRTFYLD